MKKAQLWTTDFILGTTLFIIIVLTAVQIIHSIEIDREFEETKIEARHIGDVFLTQGNPANWNESTVVIPGLITNGGLDESKLSSFSNINYNQQQRLLLLQSDFLFFFRSEEEIINISQCSYGYEVEHDEDCSFNIEEEAEYENLVVFSRYILHDAEMIEMMIYVWR